MLDAQPLVNFVEIAQVVLGVEAVLKVAGGELPLHLRMSGNEGAEVSILFIPGLMRAGLNDRVGFFTLHSLFD